MFSGGLYQRMAARQRRRSFATMAVVHGAVCLRSLSHCLWPGVSELFDESSMVEVKQAIESSPWLLGRL